MLQRNCTPKILYDDEFDVLSLKYHDNKNATAIEIGPYVLLYVDEKTNEVTAVTILDFSEAYPRKLEWESRIPIEIDFESDVLPYLN